MSYVLSVSPDFSPDHLSGWFIFNTWLQRRLEEKFHLELYDDFESQRGDIQSDKIDLIYANPYDAAMLVRDKGFKALARPSGLSDEAIIVVPESSPYQSIEELKPGVRVACTQDPDVNMMGMIMIEPADLDRSTIEQQSAGSYVLVAKALLNGQADVGFFLKDAFDDLSGLIRNQMRVLVESQIDVVHHTLMAGPKLQALAPKLLDELVAMNQDDKGRSVLESMSIKGWDAMASEDTEFMIDLIDTLID
ncbi:phosphate/phosphite/phosphonate ABC transporter substrate-binding protein [Neptunomonas marina]|uniref:Phosphate/phosphite/phosphonate ABC transporter substrate-binding protein n=1 Tax=Neptunomonas marina TaxID=1815562 RepID=A0A437Q958_9GAMM|nr:phosphate/phosphite/phosphonate ABC transporter substrate-binding protein [Neptunomonas marina]RVU31045.1 phosphate/phosphite/phosphonate ABC transporter substrate-binding protein [Neptunomonas marina]